MLMKRVNNSEGDLSYRQDERKMLQHMAAMASLISGDMKRYFELKTEQAKNKMSTINAVRNKLIHRLFSCIKNDRLYTKLHTSEYKNIYILERNTAIPVTL